MHDKPDLSSDAMLMHRAKSKHVGDGRLQKQTSPAVGVDDAIQSEGRAPPCIKSMAIPCWQHTTKDQPGRSFPFEVECSSCREQLTINRYPGSWTKTSRSWRLSRGCKDQFIFDAFSGLTLDSYPSKAHLVLQSARYLAL